MEIDPNQAVVNSIAASATATVIGLVAVLGWLVKRALS